MPQLKVQRNKICTVCGHFQAALTMPTICCNLGLYGSVNLRKEGFCILWMIFHNLFFLLRSNIQNIYETFCLKVSYLKRTLLWLYQKYSLMICSSNYITFKKIVKQRSFFYIYIGVWKKKIFQTFYTFISFYTYNKIVCVCACVCECALLRENGTT